MDGEEMELESSGSSIPLGAGASYTRSIGATEESHGEDDPMAEWNDVDADNEPRPMNTSQWIYDVKRAQSPCISYNSMASGISLKSKMNEEEPTTRFQLETTDSLSSCYSYDSNGCEIAKQRVRSQKKVFPQPPAHPELIKDPDHIRHPGFTVAFVFKALCDTLKKLSEDGLKDFEHSLRSRYQNSFRAPFQLDLIDLVDRLIECYDLEGAIQITSTLLKDMGLAKLEHYLQDLCLKNEVRCDLQMNLKRIYGHVCEGVTMEGELREEKDFRSVFSNVYISSRANNGPNIEHEVRELKKMHSHLDPDKMLTSEDILSPKMIEEEYCRTLVIVGMPGTGKSMLVQKIILDWAEGRSHEHIELLFPLPFRWLEQFEDLRMSFTELLHKLYPETSRIKDFNSIEAPIMFICDGLDEYKRELNFNKTIYCHSKQESTPLNTLLVNLLRSHMFRSSLLLVTSRPRIASILPSEAMPRRVEVLGFSDTQKEEYFRKKFEDPALADRVVAHLNSSKTFRIMCYLPLFCWGVSEELKQVFTEGGLRAELPRSVTPMYSRLLLTLLQMRRYRAPHRSVEEEKDFLLKIGKMAYNLLEKDGAVQIPKGLMNKNELDPDEAVVRSGLCTEYCKEEMVLFFEKVQCFTHCTMQEYLAALYVFLSFQNFGKNVLGHQWKGKNWKDNNLLNLYKSAVDKSLKTGDRILDIFLRFLLGMSLKANWKLLNRYMTPGKFSFNGEDIAAHIIGVIKENRHPESSENMQHCLAELGLGHLKK